MDLLKKLCSIHAPSGEEGNMQKFILQYIKKNAASWKQIPLILSGDEFQDAIILVFGKPRVGIYAHMDSIGFTVRYGRQLVKIGGPVLSEGFKLTGKDSRGKINCELLPIETEDGLLKLEYVCDREIERGTTLTFKQKWKESKDYIQSCYLDNRFGVWNALQLCEDATNCAIVFTTYEEHGGGIAGFCAKFLYENFNTRQALITDVTWATDGVHMGKGTAVSIRDSGIPRKKYLDKIVALAEKSKVKFQLEVESSGGSDGTMIQRSDIPVDWLFIGPPVESVHTPHEKMHKRDLASTLALFKYLVKHME